MPPEAFEGKADARGDVYSLGLTLYEMLAFRPAFDEKERNRLIKQVTHAEPARLGKLEPGGARATWRRSSTRRSTASRGGGTSGRPSWPPTCSGSSTTSRSRPGGRRRPSGWPAGAGAIPWSPA